MNDQADKLRKIIKELKLNSSVYKAKNDEVITESKAKVITVTSGKGGVGKTNITINLAIALRELGFRVIIIDADFGLANVDILFGMIPQYTLADVINENKSIIEVLSEDPKSRVKFISGGSGIEELAKIESEKLGIFLKKIALLDKLTDVILVDTGAGISENVISFVMAADDILLITTPEPTSVTDAYALIKLISKKDNTKKIKVIINRADSINEANDIISKLSKVSEKFLSVKIDKLGYILNDETVKKAVKQQQPFSIIYPKSMATKHIREISKRLMAKEENVIDENIGIKAFVRRLVKFMSA